MQWVADPSLAKATHAGSIAVAETLLEARGLAAGYGEHPVVRDLDLDVAAGEVVALLGPNGVGKTTIVRTLSGIIPALGGEVRLFGAPTTAPLHQRARLGMGLVTEKKAVFMRLTTKENLRVGRCASKDALETFPELGALMRRKAGLLSGGEQQILTLARVARQEAKAAPGGRAVTRPRTAGGRSTVANTASAADQGVGVLLVEQSVNQALRVADRVYVLERGHVVLSGPADEARVRLEEIERSYLARQSRRPMDPPPMTDVLAGTRILEVAMWAFVPSAGAVLADWGADVLKVELPGIGDPQRAILGTGFLPGGDGDVDYMVEIPNRGKRSIAIDLTTDDGLELLYRLAETADVFLTNWLPDARRRRRIDVEHIRARNPDIIYVRGHGQGARGPEAERGGYDSSSYWSRGGIAYAVSPPEQPHPVRMRSAFGDIMGGLTLAGAIGAALYRRERTGEASVVDVSLLNRCPVAALGGRGLVQGRRVGRRLPLRPGRVGAADRRDVPHAGRTAPEPHDARIGSLLGRPVRASRASGADRRRALQDPRSPIGASPGMHADVAADLRLQAPCRVARAAGHDRRRLGARCSSPARRTTIPR